MRGQVADLRSSVHSTRVTVSKLQELIDSLASKGRAVQVQLVPVDGHAGAGGGAGIVFSSPGALDWTFLQVGIAHPSAGTYRVILATKGGRSIDGGALIPLGKDQFVLADQAGGPREFTQSLAQVAVVIVLDPDGHPVLRGVVRPSAGS